MLSCLEAHSIYQENKSEYVKDICFQGKICCEELGIDKQIEKAIKEKPFPNNIKVKIPLEKANEICVYLQEKGYRISEFPGAYFEYQQNKSEGNEMYSIIISGWAE